jgi:hypothetical protein
MKEPEESEEMPDDEEPEKDEDGDASDHATCGQALIDAIQSGDPAAVGEALEHAVMMYAGGEEEDEPEGGEKPNLAILLGKPKRK